MARFTEGWVRLDRRAINEDIGCHGERLAIWVLLLAWANWKDSKIEWEGSPKVVPRGSLVTGVAELAAYLKFPKTNVFRQLKYLEKRDSIRIESGTRGSIITICNYENYQSPENTSGTQAERGWNADGTLAERSRNLIEQGNKGTREQRTKKTNVGIRTDYPQEFESLWAKYGKRGDKKAAFEVWKSLKLAELEIAMLERAIDAYVKNNELKYRKHFCRFLKTDWREAEPSLEAGGSSELNWDSFFGNSSGGERKAAND